MQLIFRGSMTRDPTSLNPHDYTASYAPKSKLPSDDMSAIHSQKYSYSFAIQCLFVIKMSSNLADSMQKLKVFLQGLLQMEIIKLKCWASQSVDMLHYLISVPDFI